MDEIVIITGPAGIGKSTTCKTLVRNIGKSAYVEGDNISHMSIIGREKPWESKSAHDLVWKNMKTLTENFLEVGCHVVVDWIIFMDDLKVHMSDLLESGIRIRYVILWAEEHVHIKRDKSRPKGVQMGERILIHRDEFMSSRADSRFYLDNTAMTVEEVVEKILNDDKYIVNDFN